MTYIPQGEIVGGEDNRLTTAEMRLLRRLLAILEPELIEQLIEGLELVREHGHGGVTVRYKAGEPWLVDIMLSYRPRNKLRQD